MKADQRLTTTELKQFKVINDLMLGFGRLFGVRGKTLMNCSDAELDEAIGLTHKAARDLKAAAQPAVSSHNKRQLDPARTIIYQLGGVVVVARITGKSLSRVYRWMYSTKRGGTGGLIPQRLIPALLKYAEQHHIDVKPEDFLPAKK